MHPQAQPTLILLVSEGKAIRLLRPTYVVESSYLAGVGILEVHAD